MKRYTFSIRTAVGAASALGLLLALSSPAAGVSAETLKRLRLVPADGVIEALDFSLPILEGGRASLSQHRGHVVVLNFWTPWLPWCVKERAALQKLHELFDGRGLVLLAIDMRESRALVESYKRRYRLTFPHLLDTEGNTARAYGVRYHPASFIVNKRGQIVARVTGPRPWDSPDFQRLFEEMIAEE